MSDSDRDELLHAIARHLTENGAGNWTKVSAQFPDVPPATFWRYVRKARAGAIDDHKVAEARRQISAQVVSTTSATTQLVARADRPSEIAGWRGLNLLGTIDQVFSDIALLRKSVLNADGTIRNPHLFGQTVSMREKTVATALRCGEAILEQERMWTFFDHLVEEIAAESPELAARVCDRLRGLIEGRLALTT